MTTASRSLATALPMGALRERLALPSYTTTRDVTRVGGPLSLERDITEQMLFGSGRPVIVVPPAAGASVVFENILIAWDGGAQAARAIGDAMPFLGRASSIDVVCVSGDPNPSKRIEGAEIAEHLSRHFRSVKTTTLPPIDGELGAAIRTHATLTRADLIVMGGYAHSRLYQIVLGGVTKDMLQSAAIPVFLSY